MDNIMVQKESKRSELVRTTIALIIKFAATYLAAMIAFGYINDNSTSWILMVALAGTILNWVLGDLFVLPRYGNVIAAIGDGVMAAATAFIIDLFSTVFDTTLVSLITFAVIVAVAEYFFHMYLKSDNKVGPKME
jgi:hypothetical protein